jgi:hypothetical protein
MRYLLLLQSIAAAASFFYSSHLGLHPQLGIMVATGIVGTLSFCVVEWKDKKKKRANYNNGEIETSCVEATSVSVPKRE